MLDLKNKYQDGKISKSDYITQMYKYHDNLYKYAKLLPKTNIKSIVIEDNAVYMETRDLGLKLVCKEQDERIAPVEMLNFNDYEKEEWDIIDRILEISGSNTFFDIGANIGYISLYIGKKHKNMIIHAFEPVTPTYKILEKNMQINNMNNIAIHNIGLSDKKGKFTFFYYPEGSGNASLKNLSGRENVQEIICEIDTLDSVFENMSERSLDFMKCDVEGAELMVLKGGVNTIADKKPVIFAELLRKWSKSFNYTPNDVLSFLNNLNYECCSVKNNELQKITAISNETIETNFIFLHKEKHKSVLQLVL